MRLYNFLTKETEEFKPIHDDWVGLYACGPTVYNFAHIGNLRTYIFEDVLTQTLKIAFPKHEIRQVTNITDIDDKIIRDAKKSGKDIAEFTKPYEESFYEDLAKLNIQPAWKYPKATEHISEMIEIISRLLEKGLAYESDGSVYFDIKKFKKYGRLSGIDKAELKAGARVEADEYNKENAQDFALWKGKKDGEPSWLAPFGEGRPGWHIECSAMSMKYLGETFDIHAGAIDLLFPHHENEIAQSEGSTDKKFANFFVEAEHLLVDGKKMSKSLGNFYTLRDIEKKGFDSLEFRYLALNAHYRSSLNFTEESMSGAKNGLNNFRNDVLFFKQLLEDYDKFGIENPVDTKKDVEELVKKFREALSDDLNTPIAVSALSGLLTRKLDKTRDSIKLILTAVGEMDKVLALDLNKYKLPPKKIKKLAAERKKYRDGKNWPEADEARKKIEESGWEILDIKNWFILEKKHRK